MTEWHTGVGIVHQVGPKLHSGPFPAENLSAATRTDYRGTTENLRGTMAPAYSAASAPAARSTRSPYIKEIDALETKIMKRLEKPAPLPPLTLAEVEHDIRQDPDARERLAGSEEWRRVHARQILEEDETARAQFGGDVECLTAYLGGLASGGIR